MWLLLRLQLPQLQVLLLLLLLLQLLQLLIGGVPAHARRPCQVIRARCRSRGRTHNALHGRRLLRLVLTWPRGKRCSRALLPRAFPTHRGSSRIQHVWVCRAAVLDCPCVPARLGSVSAWAAGRLGALHALNAVAAHGVQGRKLRLLRHTGEHRGLLPAGKAGVYVEAVVVPRPPGVDVQPSGT